ncbi:MAG: hypothetical protein HUJ58_02485, partial [Erysipelotrichaceae bacterium]|nr:hypothetical protein [Erysipelotrichaceae bacterium]
MNREEIDAFLDPYGMEMVDVLEPWKANLAQVVWFDGNNLLLEAEHTAFAIVDSKESWKQIRKWIGAHTVTMLHAPFDETDDLKEDGFEKLVYQKTVYYPKKEPVAVQLPDTVTLQWLT